MITSLLYILFVNFVSPYGQDKINTPDLILVVDPTITWPDDFMICVTDPSQIADLIDPDNLAPPFDKPIVTGPCSPYGIAYEDTAYEFNLCTKIFRKWTVIDWCQYNPNKPNSPGKWTHTQIIKVIIKNGPIEPCGGI